MIVLGVKHLGCFTLSTWGGDDSLYSLMSDPHLDLGYLETPDSTRAE